MNPIRLVKQPVLYMAEGEIESKSSPSQSHRYLHAVGLEAEIRENRLLWEQERHVKEYEQGFQVVQEGKPGQPGCPPGL